MTKKQLEAYGRTVGIELDRRETKATLLDVLAAHLDATEEVDLTAQEDVDLTAQEDVDLTAQEEVVEEELPPQNDVFEFDKILAEAKAAGHEEMIEHQLKSSVESALVATTTQIHVPSTEQSNRDARRMADHAKETSHQVELSTKIIIDQAAATTRMAEDAIRHADDLLASSVTPRDKEFVRQARYAARVLVDKAKVARRLADEATARAILQTKTTATAIAKKE